MLNRNFMTNLQSNLKRMEKYQNQLSTGRSFNRPSEDPIAAVRSLQVRNDLNRTEQYLKNVKDSITWLEQSENSLNEINEVIKRAYQLAVDAANGVKTEDDRQIVSHEIQQLQEQLVQAANASFNGRFLFGGYNTASKPFVLGGTPGDYTLTYNGKDLKEWTENENIGRISYEAGLDLNFTVSFTGLDVFGAGADNLFEVFNSFNKALLTDDSEMISQSIDKLQQQQNRILSLLGEVGGKHNRLTLIEKRYDQDIYNLKEAQSNIEYVDYAEAVMNSKMAEIVYQAALSAAAGIMQPTLIDFLR